MIRHRTDSDAHGVLIRPAIRADAAALARHVNMAGEGLPLWLWRGMAEPGEDPWDVGRRRAERDTGGFSWRNAQVAEVDGVLVGSLIGYPLDVDPGPVDTSGVPPLIAPMLRLEAIADGSWYINVIAVEPHARGRGNGARLLESARNTAAAVGRTSLSLIVANNNLTARRLYERAGFRAVADEPVIRDSWETEASRWILMVAA